MVKVYEKSVVWTNKNNPLLKEINGEFNGKGFTIYINHLNQHIVAGDFTKEELDYISDQVINKNYF